MIPSPKPLAELAEELSGKTETPQDSRESRDHRFKFRHVDGRGKTWEGVFINRVLTPAARIQVSSLKSDAFGRRPLDSIDAATEDLVHRLCWMTLSLVSKPKTWPRLDEIVDDGVIDALWAEVSAHEATFRGRGPDQAARPTEDAGGDGDAPGVGGAEEGDLD